MLRFIDSLPQRDRKVFSYEAQMTRLEEEIQRYKKVEIVFRYRDEFARAMEVAKSYKDRPLPAAV